MKLHSRILVACLAMFVSARAAEPIKSEVTGQNFVADFYCSPDATNAPGILYFGGSEGGKPHSALPQMFAQNGYAVLAVAYFKEKNLPQTLQLVPLEYFDKPIQWMKENKKIRPGGIVVAGASKGAELALLLASRQPAIKGVVALSPSSVVWDGLPESFWPPQPKSSWSLHGDPLPFVPYDYSQPFQAGDPLAVFKFYQRSLTQTDAVQKAAIEVEKISGPILLASGEADQLWPSTQMSDAICARLKEKNFRHKYDHLKFKDAGHTLNEFFMMGGTAEGNKSARIELSKRMLSFLKETTENSRPQGAK